MDAANVDLKAFTEDFYHRTCAARLGRRAGHAALPAARDRRVVRDHDAADPGPQRLRRRDRRRDRLDRERARPRRAAALHRVPPGLQDDGRAAHAAGDAAPARGASPSATGCDTSTPATSTTPRAARRPVRAAAPAVVVRDWYAMRAYRLDRRRRVPRTAARRLAGVYRRPGRRLGPAPPAGVHRRAARRGDRCGGPACGHRPWPAPSTPATPSARRARGRAAGAPHGCGRRGRGDAAAGGHRVPARRLPLFGPGGGVGLRPVARPAGATRRGPGAGSLRAADRDRRAGGCGVRDAARGGARGGPHVRRPGRTAGMGHRRRPPPWPEHSIEVQLPFLQRVLADGWTCVPLVVGATAPSR